MCITYVEARCWSALVTVRGVNEYGTHHRGVMEVETYVRRQLIPSVGTYPDYKPDDFCIAWDR